MANAEKVVKPPQNPVASNNLMSLFPEELFAMSAKIAPMMKQPSRLTENVPNGNFDETLFCKYAEKMNRITPPNALPVKTKKIFLMFIISEVHFLKMYN